MHHIRVEEVILKTGSKAEVQFWEEMSGTLVGTRGMESEETPAVMRGTVAITDLSLFLNNPDHRAIMDAEVKIGALSSSWVPAHGYVDLFSPGNIKGRKLMRYELDFDHSDTSYKLSGTKDIHDDHGFDAWRDMTTLFTTIGRATDDGEVLPCWSGTLTLSLTQAARLMMTCLLYTSDAADE